MYCDLFTCFLYLTDVEEGDGGLVVIPGSHHSNFYCEAVHIIIVIFTCPTSLLA